MPDAASPRTPQSVAAFKTAPKLSAMVSGVHTGAFAWARVSAQKLAFVHSMPSPMQSGFPSAAVMADRLVGFVVATAITSRLPSLLRWRTILRSSSPAGTAGCSQSGTRQCPGTTVGVIGAGTM